MITIEDLNYISEHIGNPAYSIPTGERTVHELLGRAYASMGDEKQAYGHFMKAVAESTRTHQPLPHERQTSIDIPGFRQSATRIILRDSEASRKASRREETAVSQLVDYHLEKDIGAGDETHILDIITMIKINK